MTTLPELVAGFSIFDVEHLDALREKARRDLGMAILAAEQTTNVRVGLALLDSHPDAAAAVLGLDGMVTTATRLAALVRLIDEVRRLREQLVLTETRLAEATGPVRWTDSPGGAP